MTDRQKIFLEASKQYIEQEKKNEEVIGIIVSGSFIHSKIDKNSDVDIFLILDPKCTYRERGNTWIQGVEIEYFKNPPIQIKRYLEREISPHTAHILANGQVVYSTSDIIDELIATSKTILQQPPPKLKEFQVELAKYVIDDYYKDFEDAAINKDEIGTTILRNRIIEKCIDVFFNVHQIRRYKDKGLSQQLEQIDPTFNQKIKAALLEQWNEPTALTEVRTAAEILLGGQRTKEWKLKSPLDL